MKTYCDINMNGSAVLWVDARQHSSATDNFQEASNSVGIHLNQGDVNDLRCSSDNNTFDFMTSFMGFLLYPVD